MSSSSPPRSTPDRRITSPFFASFKNFSPKNYRITENTEEGEFDLQKFAFESDDVSPPTASTSASAREAEIENTLPTQQQSYSNQQVTETLVDNVVELCKKVFKKIKFGHSEAVYHTALEAELQYNGIFYTSKPSIPIRYFDDSDPNNRRYKIIGRFEPDLIVGEPPSSEQIVVELKALQRINQASIAQLQKYLHETKIGRGVLVNFPQAGNRAAQSAIEIYHEYYMGEGDNERYGGGIYLFDE